MRLVAALLAFYADWPRVPAKRFRRLEHGGGVMRFRSWTACVAIAAMTAGASAASASAATTNFDLPVSGTVSNDCTGELVAIEGTSHNKVTDNSSLSGIKYQIESN